MSRADHPSAGSPFHCPQSKRNAYDRLVERSTATTSALAALAESMRSYRDLPLAPHDESVLSDKESAGAFASLVRAEQDALEFLRATAAEHGAMLSAMKLPRRNDA